MNLRHPKLILAAVIATAIGLTPIATIAQTAPASAPIDSPAAQGTGAQGEQAVAKKAKKKTKKEKKAEKKAKKKAKKKAQLPPTTTTQ